MLILLWMVDLHGSSMNGSTFIEFSMAQKNLILIRFKIILDLTQPLKCLEVLCAAKRRMIKELSDRMVCVPWQSDITQELITSNNKYYLWSRDARYKMLMFRIGITWSHMCFERGGFSCVWSICMGVLWMVQHLLNSQWYKEGSKVY